MSSIDERIVQMEFDNKAFEKDVAVTINTLGKLKEELKLEEASKGFDELTKAAKKVDLTHITESVDALQKRFSVFGEFVHQKLTAVLDRAFGMITALPTKAFNIFWSMTDFGNLAAGMDKFKDKTEAVQKIMNATRLSIEDVNVQIEKLNWFTDETSYNLTDMISNIGSFTNVGVPLDIATTSMIGIADAAGFAGIGIQGASHAMEGFSKAMAAGYMSLQNWKWIKTAGMNTKDFQQQLILAAEELGVIEKGQISVANLETTLKDRWMTTEVMNRALSKFGKTTEEIYDLIEDYEGNYTASQVLDALGKVDGMLDDIGYKSIRASQEAKTFAEVIGSVQDAVSTKWMQSFELIFGNKVEATQQVWSPMAESLYELFAEAGNTRNAILGVWKSLGGRDRLIMTVANLFNGLVGVLDRLKGVFPIFQLESDAFINKLGNDLNSITNVLYNLSKAFKSTFAISEEEKSANDYEIQRHFMLRRIIDDYISTGKLTDENKKKLAEYGVTLDTVDKQIKSVKKSTDKNASASEIARDVVNNLEEEEKELAKAQAQTTGTTDDQVETLREFNSVGDAATYLITTIKAGLISALKGAAPLARDIVYLGREAIGLIVNIVKTIAAFVNAIATATGEVNEINSVTKAVYYVLKPLQIVIRLITAVLMIASEKLTEFRENIDNTQSISALIDSFKNLAGILLGLGARIGGTILKLFTTLASLFVKSNNEIKPFGNGVANLVYLFSRLVDRVTVVIRYVGAFAVFVGEALVSAIRSLIDAWNTREEKGVFYTILNSKTFSLLQKLWGVLTLCAGAVKNFFASFVIDVESGNPFGFIDRLKEKFSGWFSLTKQAEGSGQNFVFGIARGIQNGIKGLWEIVKNLASMVLSTFNKGLRIESPSKDGEESGEYFVDGIILGIKKALAKIGGATEKLGNAIIDSLMTFFKGFDFELLGKVLKSLALFNGARGIGAIASAIKNTSNILKGLGDTIKDFNKGKGPLADTLSSLQDVAKSYKKLIGAKAIREVAVSVGILVGSIIALLAAIKFMKITPQELIMAGAAVATCLAGITVSLKMLLKATKDASWQEIGATATLLAGLSSAIISISLALLGLSLASKFGLDLGPGIKAIAIVIGTLTASIAIMTNSLRNKDTIDPKNILSITALIATMGLVVQGIAIAVAGLSFVPAKKLDNGLKALVGIIGSITASMAILSASLRNKDNTISPKNILSLAVLVSAMTMSVQGMALAVAGLSFIKDSKKLMLSVGSLMVIIGSMTLSVASLAKVLKSKKGELDPKNLLALSTSIIAMAAAVGIMATALGALTIISSKVDGGLADSVISIVVLIGSLTIAMSALAAVFSDVNGVNAGDILAVSASFIAMAVAINMLVVPIATLGSIPLPVVAIGLGAIAASLLIFVGAAALTKLILPGMVALTAAMLSFGAMTLAIGVGIKLFAAGFAGLIATLLLVGSSASTIVRGFGVIADGLVNFVSRVLSGIANLADKLETVVHILIVVALKAIVDLIPDVLEVITFLATRLLEVLAKYIEPFTNAVINIVFGIVKALVEHIPDFVDLLIEALHIFADVIRNQTPALVEAIGDVLDAIWDVITGWVTSLFDWMNEHPWYDGLFPKDFEDKLHDLHDKTGVLFSKDFWKDFFDINAILKGDGVEAGANFGAGVVEGTEATKDFVKASGSNLGNSLTTGTMESLDEHSPSRIAMAIGAFFSAGLALGIIDGKGAVTDAANNLTNGPIEALDKLEEASHGGRGGSFDSFVEGAEQASEATRVFRIDCLEMAVAMNEAVQKSKAYKDIAKMELLNEKGLSENFTAALSSGLSNVDTNAVQQAVAPIGEKVGSEFNKSITKETEKINFDTILEKTSKITDVVSSVAETISKVAKAIKDVSAIFKAASTAVGAVVNPVVAATGLINAISNSVTVLVDSLIKLGENMPAFVAGFQGLVLGIVGAVELLLLSLPDLVRAIGLSVAGIGEEIVLGLYGVADFIEANAPALCNAIGKIIYSIVTAPFTGITGLILGIIGIDYKRPIDNAYRNLDKSLTTFDKNVQNRTKKSGAYAGTGYALGLAETKEVVDEVSKDVADSSATEMENALEVNSPSRRTMRIGIFTGAGLASGISEMLGLIGDTSYDAGDTAATNIGNGAGIEGSSSPRTTGYGKTLAGGFVSPEVQHAWNQINEDYYEEGKLLPENLKRGAADAMDGTSFGAIIKNAWSKVVTKITGGKPIDIAPEVSDDVVKDTIDSLEKDIEKGREKNERAGGFHSREQQELLKEEAAAREKAAAEEKAAIEAQQKAEEDAAKAEEDLRKKQIKLQNDYYNDRIDVGHVFEKENEKLLQKGKENREKERQDWEKQYKEREEEKKRLVAQENSDFYTEYYLNQAGMTADGEKKVVDTSKNRVQSLTDRIDEILEKYQIVPPDANIDLTDALTKIEDLTKSEDGLGDVSSDTGDAVEDLGESMETAGDKAGKASKGIKSLGKNMKSLDFKDYASNVIKAEQKILQSIDYANFGVKQALSLFKSDATAAVQNYINKIGDLEALQEQYADVSEENNERQNKIDADLKDAFISRFEEIEEAIKSSIDIWNKLDKTSRGSTKSVQDNLADQKKSYEKWAKGIRELAKRGLDFDIVQELISGGLSTYGDVRTFLQFTPEEMRAFNEDYGNWILDASEEAKERLTDEVTASYTQTAKEVWTPLAKTAAEQAAEALGKTLDEYKSFVSDIRSMLTGTLDVFNKYEEQSAQSLINSTKNILSQKNAINEYNDLFEYAAKNAKLGTKTLEWIKELGMEEGMQILKGIRYATKQEVIDFQKMINGFFKTSKENANKISGLIAESSGNNKKTLGEGIDDVKVLAEKAAMETAEKVKESVDSTLTKMKDGIKSVIHSFSAISEVTKTESSDLTKNLLDQSAEVEEWSNSLVELARRGLGRNVIEQLADQGVSSLGIVRGFMDMSLAELKDYNKKWINQTNDYKDTSKMLKASLNKLYSDEDKTSDWFYRNADSAAKDFEIKQKRVLASLRNEYSTVTAKIKDLVKNQINIFEKFDKTADISAKKLIRNMRSQVDGIKTWAENLETLSARGITQPLLDKLQSLGPNGYKYTQAFVDMTDEQLQEAAELFAESEMLPDSISQNVAASYMATGQDVAQAFADGLSGNYSIDAIKSFGNAALVALQGAFGILENNPTVSAPAYDMGAILARSEMEAYTETSENVVNPTLEATGEETVDSTADAIVDEIKNEATPKIQEAAKDMTETLVFTIRDTILNYKKRLKWYGSNIVYYISQGMSLGVNQYMSPVVESVTAMMERMVAAAQKAVRVSSPSKVFYEIGQYIDEGLANGISHNSALPEEDAEEMCDYIARIAKDAMSRAMELANDELSTDPVIRPVLDLSDVQNGSGLISDMFANRMLDVSGINFVGKSQISDEMIGQLSDAILALKDSNNTGINGNPVVINVYGAAGQDASAIADEVMYRINTQFNNRKAVYA